MINKTLIKVMMWVIIIFTYFSLTNLALDFLRQPNNVELYLGIVILFLINAGLAQLLIKQFKNKQKQK